MSGEPPLLEFILEHFSWPVALTPAFPFHSVPFPCQWEKLVLDTSAYQAYRSDASSAGLMGASEKKKWFSVIRNFHG